MDTIEDLSSDNSVSLDFTEGTTCKIILNNEFADEAFYCLLVNNKKALTFDDIDKVSNC